MTPYLLLIALITQSTLIFANDVTEITDAEQVPEITEEELISRDVLKIIDPDDEVVKDFHEAKKDWSDLLMTPGSTMNPFSSATLMSQVKNSNMTMEEQLEMIKGVTSDLLEKLSKEMENVLSLALSNKNTEENSLRKKRSIETPMDSAQLVMRLLKHIKSNNDYQNTAIDKMMTAQEIADKFGIDFTPDTEMLSDLAVAANQQALEMTELLRDACDGKNATEENVHFVPKDNNDESAYYNSGNDNYYIYELHPEISQENDAFAPFEYAPEQFNSQPSVNHFNYPEQNHYSYPREIYPNQPPQHNSAPVTPKPNFYDSMMAFTPEPEYYTPYCPMEPITTTTTTIVLPIDEPYQPEPELVGEEYEETISSKLIVDHNDEPGAATVNHITTYTLSDKAHFRTPQIQQLPQQMQYAFFLL